VSWGSRWAPRSVSWGREGSTSTCFQPCRRGRDFLSLAVRGDAVQTDAMSTPTDAAGPMVVRSWIDGVPTGSVTRLGDVYDPATGEVTKQVALADGDDVRAAVASALRAFTGWRDISLSRRTSILFAFRELFERP